MRLVKSDHHKWQEAIIHSPKDGKSKAKHNVAECKLKWITISDLA
jgi:hypothetical protein